MLPKPGSLVCVLAERAASLRRGVRAILGAGAVAGVLPASLPPPLLAAALDGASALLVPAAAPLPPASRRPPLLEVADLEAAPPPSPGLPASAPALRLEKGAIVTRGELESDGKLGLFSFSGRVGCPPHPAHPALLRHLVLSDAEVVALEDEEAESAAVGSELAAVMGRRRLARLRRLLVCGPALGAGALGRIAAGLPPSARLLRLYCSAEGTALFLAEGRRKPESVGRPLADAKVVCPKTGSPLGEGEAGRVWAASTYTGWIGFRDTEGDYTLLKRDPESSVLHKGYEFDLSEVESALRSIDGVKDAGAVLTRGGRLLAGAVLAAGVEPEEVAGELSGLVPSHMVPSRLLEVEALPRGGGGTLLDRTALAALLSPPPSPTPREFVAVSYI